MESKYLDRFAKVRNSEHVILRGDRMIVEVLPKEELKSAGGILLQAPSDQRGNSADFRPTLAVVLMTGAGYVDEEGADVPLEFEPGNVILVSEMGLKLYSQFPALQDFTANTIGLTRESEVHMYWPTIEAFQAYKATLNS